jgi:hypothetical protein
MRATGGAEARGAPVPHGHRKLLEQATLAARRVRSGSSDSEEEDEAPAGAREAPAVCGGEAEAAVTSAASPSHVHVGEALVEVTVLQTQTGDGLPRSLLGFDINNPSPASRAPQVAPPAAGLPASIDVASRPGSLVSELSASAGHLGSDEAEFFTASHNTPSWSRTASKENVQTDKAGERRPRRFKAEQAPRMMDDISAVYKSAPVPTKVEHGNEAPENFESKLEETEEKEGISEDQVRALVAGEPGSRYGMHSNLVLRAVLISRVLCELACSVQVNVSRAQEDEVQHHTETSTRSRGAAAGKQGGSGRGDSEESEDEVAAGIQDLDQASPSAKTILQLCTDADTQRSAPSARVKSSHSRVEHGLLQLHEGWRHHESWSNHEVRLHPCGTVSTPLVLAQKAIEPCLIATKT